jgi:hypothetical protein
LLQLVSQFVDFGAATTYGNTRPSRVNLNGNSLWLPLNIDARNPCSQETLLDVSTQHLIFIQKFGKVFFGKPIGSPTLNNTKPKAVWVCLLSQKELP